MVICPLSGSNDVGLVEVFDTSKIIHDWKQLFNIDVSNEFKKHKSFELYICYQSKLRFFFPLDIAGSDHLYAQLQAFDWYYAAEKWEYGIALRNLADSHQILEVGSGSGTFIKRAKEKGIDAKGIDINEAAVTAAQKNCLSVEYMTIQQYRKIYTGYFDAVCSFQVLEHIPFPDEFIEILLLMLKKNGKLILSVPNAESNFLRYQYNLLDMPPHHMTQWSESTFRYLEKKYPIELDKVYNEPLGYYHIANYLKTLAGHYISISRLFAIIFNRLTMPLFIILLKIGFRRLFSGHSIYVQFRKV